jgi:hypothetical protein
MGTNRPGPISIGTDDIQGLMTAFCGLNGNALDLILHSPGGSLEAAEQIVSYVRAKYKHVRAIVPLNAMSAATMIACACDEIVMGKQSAIGPIDPQISFPTKNGPFTAPAQALLDDFDQAKQEVTTNPKLAALWINKIGDYPPGIFQICEQTLKLSKEKVKGWLEAYMFNGQDKAAQNAKSIADWLGDARLHKTHGHPISIAEAGEKGLKVKALESDQALQDLVLSVFHSTAVTFDVTSCVKIVENHKGKGWYLQFGTARNA